jgi:hypothetical protein
MKIDGILVSAINAISPAVRQALHDHAKEQTRWLPLLTPKGTSFDHHDLLSEWVNYVFQQLSDEPTQEEIDAVQRNALREATAQTDRADGVTDQVLEDVIHDAIDTVMDINWRAKGGGLQLTLDKFADLKLVARVVTPDAEINVLRQGFILLMTAFDAAIFDLVRVALGRKFFALAAAFGKQDKVSVAEIAEAGSFEALRDRLIEEQLKKRYIKDLLVLIGNNWGVQCVAPASGQKFERMIELVLRRNLHVHNRGIVDTRYVEDKNLDGLKLGEVAAIDESYWEMANSLCKRCVEQVAAWADA